MASSLVIVKKCYGTLVQHLLHLSVLFAYFCFLFKDLQHSPCIFQHFTFFLSQRIAHFISAVVVVSILQTVVFIWCAGFLHRNSTDGYVIDYYDHDVGIAVCIFLCIRECCSISYPIDLFLPCNLFFVWSRTKVNTLVDPYYGVIRLSFLVL